MKNLQFRRATKDDVELYFNWLNEKEVRINSYNSEIISWEKHIKWFNEKIIDSKYSFYIFQNLNNEYIGQVRINQLETVDSIIGLSIDKIYRGLGYGPEMLTLACEDYFNKYPNASVHAYIKIENLASKYVFEKAGFIFFNKIIYQNFLSYHYIKYANRSLQNRGK